MNFENRQTPERVRTTFAPPDICSSCFWLTKLKQLESAHKTLRIELVRLRAEAKKKPPAERMERMDLPRAWEHSVDGETFSEPIDPETMQALSRITGDDE